MNTSDLKSFHYLENGEIAFSNLDTLKTNKKLDNGIYKVTYIEKYPESRVELKISTDIESPKIHDFPDKHKIDDLFTSFFNDKVAAKILENGFYHKTGILFYGKEGTGKSTIIKHYCHRAMNEHDAIVFYIIGTRLQECWDFICNVRKVQPNPFIVVLEEIDYQLENRNETVLKTLLDGNLSIDNCIFMASTNYIDAVPDAIKNRPSRFKYSLNIEGIQSEQDIFKILHKMIGDIFNDADIKIFSSQLKGNSLDEIKQFGVDKIMDLTSYSKKRNAIGFIRDKINEHFN